MTPNRICFYAKLPKNQVSINQGVVAFSAGGANCSIESNSTKLSIEQDVVLKEGFFNKKSSKTGWYSRYWFVLKNDVLSWYSDRNVGYTQTGGGAGP